MLQSFVERPQSFSEDQPKSFLIDPGSLANFNKRSRKEYLKQLRLAQSLKGKKIARIHAFGNTAAFQIEGIATSGYESFQDEGMDLLVNELKDDGTPSPFHSHLSLRQALMYAQEIEAWSPARAATNWRNLRYEPLETIPENLIDHNANLSHKESTLTYWEIDRGRTLKSTENLSELSSADRIELERDDLIIKQVGIVTASRSNSFDYLIHMAGQLGAEVRVVEAKSLKTGRPVSGMVRIVEDSRGKKLLLFSKDILSRPKEDVDRFGVLAIDHASREWLQTDICKWARKEYGQDVSMPLAFYDTKVSIEKAYRPPSALRIGNKNPASVFDQLRAESVQAMNRAKLDIRESESLEASGQDVFLHLLIKSFEEKGGKVELVTFLKKGTNEEVSNSGAMFVRGKKGEPILLVTKQTQLTYIMPAWVEYLNSGFKK